MSNEPDLNFRGNENVFRTLIEESPTPIALYAGRDMIIRVANPTILKIWGKGNDVIDKSYYTILPELEAQAIFKLLDQVYTTGIIYEATEYELYLKRNGEMQKFYFNFTFKPLKDDDGNVWGIINTAADVTELVLTRQQLAESEERTTFALNSAELGTWNLNPITQAVIWDKRCQELFGFRSDDQVEYKDVLSCIHTDDIEYVRNAVLQSVDARQPYDIKYRTIGVENKRLRWIRAKGKAYFDENDICIRFAGTAQDITREVADNEQQQKLIAVVDNAAEIIGVSDMDGTVTYMNKAGYKMLGIQNPEQAHVNAIEYFMPADAPVVESQATAALMETGVWEKELHYRNFTTGEAVPVYLNVFRIDDPVTGKPIAVASVGRDLRPEKAARNEQDKLLSLIDHSSDFVSLSDLDGNVTYVNAAGQKMVGIGHDNIQRHNSEFLIPGELDKLRNEINKAIHEKGKWTGEITYRHFKTGAPIPVSATSMLVYDAVTGAPQGRASVARDMRREVSDKKALVDQIKQFEFVTDFMPVQLWTARVDGNLDFVNQRALDFFGKEAKEIVGPEWLEHVHPDDRDDCIAKWSHSLATGDTYQYEFRLKNNEGIYKWHLARALPFINEEGITLKWFGTNTDIDEQKQLQQQKDDFLGIASHELKTPVTSIKAYAQVLGAMLTKEGEEKKAEMVARMDAQVNRLTNLIGDLLDVTKINSGRLQFNPSWFDLTQVINEAVDDLQHTTQKHTLVKDFSPTGEIYTDRDRIGQVITNLITNAIKYSPHSDTIIINTKREDDEVIVCVKDFGIGIPVDKTDKVFEQFYRVSGDKQHTFPGLGLGLYISSEIIKREGGRMWVNSIEGKGATFCFALPVTTTQQPS